MTAVVVKSNCQQLMFRSQPDVFTEPERKA